MARLRTHSRFQPCQNYLIITEQFMLMTKSNIGFLAIKGQSGQFSNLSDISYIVTLSASFRNKFFYVTKINDPIWPAFETSRDFIHDPALPPPPPPPHTHTHIHIHTHTNNTRICKFQKDPIKTEGVILMTNFFPM